MTNQGNITEIRNQEPKNDLWQRSWMMKIQFIEERQFQSHTKEIHEEQFRWEMIIRTQGKIGLY